MGETGIHAEKFRPFVPSVESTLGKVNTLLKPGTSEEEANVIAHAQAPFRNIPDIPEGTFNVGSPSQQSGLLHPDIPSSLESPESAITQKITNLLEGKQNEQTFGQKPQLLGHGTIEAPSFGLTSTDTESGVQPTTPIGGDVTKQNIYGIFGRRGEPIETGRVQEAASAGTEGRAKGIEAVNAAPGQGTAQAKIESITRPEKVETTRQNAQAQEDVRHLPKNIAGEANRSSAIEYANQTAKDRAILAGIPPETAQSYIHGTTTGKSYMFFPAGTDHAVIKAAQIRTAQNPATQGIRIVTPADHTALQNIQTARENYDRLVQLVMGHVAKDYRGNIAQAPVNYIEQLASKDPEIRTVLTASYPQLIESLRAIAGPFGRITQQEINRASGTLPSPYEPLSVLLEKYKLFFDTLETTEGNILR